MAGTAPMVTAMRPRRAGQQLQALFRDEDFEPPAIHQHSWPNCGPRRPDGA